jgi:branched-chain amino acid transport system ATP-binding protein
MAAALELTGVVAGYGSGTVLRSLDLTVDAGEVVAVVGRNGVGKTTLMQTVMGLTNLTGGRILVGGEDTTSAGPTATARAGVGYVPQGRRIFPTLTVDEHLRIACRPGRWTPEKVYARFPRLFERRRNGGAQLSGGEQQMLAVGRALVGNPSVLLLDEPSEGLAPALVAQVMDLLRELSEGGLGVLLVEQDLAAALRAADRIAVLDHGTIGYQSPAEPLRGHPEAIEQLLAPG